MSSQSIISQASATSFDERIDEIAEQLAKYKAEGKRIFASSSFQPQSVVLLDIISRIDKSIPVYFLDTNYHFPETIEFRDQLAEQLGINVIDIKSNIPVSEQVDENGEPLYKNQPDRCCHINKVEPIEDVLKEHDVWINGIRKGQSAVRAQMQKEEEGKHGVLRYHPILDWDSKMIFQYINERKLPLHSLVAKGYFSVGCLPCTAKADPTKPLWSDDRSGRWSGQGKTECGLHTTLGK
ncbi:MULTISPECIES: phosphoadenylyl-sulfate reductase [Flammeovirga]|uniref:Adenosine 5'-phosphosulfate reductase n=1 Tax=Flammeovirga agarivorans TaxID=2726742 RepID=A0A7X8SJ05_9BACT|nr:MULTISPECIES: phosphoadenylyl-sulfate reductase [Flammeovirga]NLR91032.1 phosphoadenylyl-sulfate reductase [Flammeovirga agarivorans]